MLKLIQVEFLKLRRRKFIWLMLLAALFMPLAAVFYFSSVKGTGVDPIMFYKWTAFSYTPWIILGKRGDSYFFTVSSFTVP